MAGNSLRNPVPLHHLGRKPRAGDRRASSTARRRAWRSPNPTSSTGSTSASPASRALPPSGARRDLVRIMSGVFDGVTTGTPIQLLIENTDQRSKDYDATSPTAFAPATPTIPIGRNTACATIAAAAAPRRARPPRGSPPAPSRARSSAPASQIRGALVQIGPHAIDRSAWDWQAVERQPVLVPRRGRWRALGRLSRRRAQGRLLGRCGHRDRGERCPRRARRADLRQARRRSRPRADDDQRGQGRRDRRRVRRRGTQRRGQRRRDAHGATAGSSFCRTTPAASSAASRPGRTSSPASRSSRRARS